MLIIIDKKFRFHKIDSFVVLKCISRFPVLSSTSVMSVILVFLFELSSRLFPNVWTLKEGNRMLALPVMERRTRGRGREGGLNYQFPSAPLCMPALRPKSQRDEEIYLLTHKWHTYCTRRHRRTVFVANGLYPHIARTVRLTLRRLMSYIYIYIYIYIYGAPILDVSRSHTTTQHSR